MSLDIALYTDDPELPEVEMNWLRNPFGLRDWAEDNYRIATGAGEREIDLYHVINHWNYDRAEQVDRPLFKRVVDEYGAVLSGLDRGYFVFDLSGYIQFVEPHLSLINREYIIPSAPEIGTRIAGSKYVGKGACSRLAIPQEHFAPRAFNLGRCTLDRYKEWFGELVRFAELLQDERYRFYCSN